MTNTNEKQGEYPQLSIPQSPNPPPYPTQGPYRAQADCLDPPIANIQTSYSQQQGFVLLEPPKVQGLQLPGFVQSQQYPQGANLAAEGYPKEEGYSPGLYPGAGSYLEQTLGDNPPQYREQTVEGEEESCFKSFDFTEETVRKSFMRKVYSILMCQLMVTVGFITFFVFHEPTKYWCQRNIWIMLAASPVVLICIFVMAFCEEVRRKYPMNFIFLSIFTLAKSLTLGVFSAYYNGNEVLIAIGLTAAICLGLTIFAFQTKWEFTIIGGFLICALLVLIIIGTLACYTSPNRQLRLWLSGLGVLLFSLYLVYDTQLMMAGGHKYTISPEEYIFAALSLYLDIINIFIRILILLARR